MGSQAPIDTGSGSGPIAIPVIIGPTAAGKTGLALDLAGHFGDIEIISADSRQVYTSMDIGTAKPSPDELRAVPHHMIDIITPDTLYSAGMYAAAARAAIDAVLRRGRLPVVAGGSGFYVKALFEGLGAPTVDQELLERLKNRGEVEGYDALYCELAAIDPVAAAAHSANNTVKTLRALCCWYQTGRPYSTFTGEEALAAAPYRPVYLGIAPPREELYDRINNRVLAMLDAGLLRETETLLAAGYLRDAPGLRTVGYAEAIAHLTGAIDYATMTSAIQQSTRRYAKRQMTWFKKVEGIFWMEKPDLTTATRWLQNTISPKNPPESKIC